MPVRSRDDLAFTFAISCYHALFFPHFISIGSGDLWSGSENGSIKVWPWEVIERALFLPAEKRHIAALTVERSFIDLRSQVAVNGFNSILTSDIKNLLSDKCRAKVWSAGFLSFALWYV